jgi:hypothetical protein
MPWSRSVSVDSAKGPSWNLVIVLILTVAVETAADIWSRYLKPNPNRIEYAECTYFCKDTPFAITRDSCACAPPLVPVKPKETP